MEKGATTKCVALAVTVAVMAIAVVGVDHNATGVSKGCSLTQRFVYHFVHANIFHALCNVWCLLSIAFLYPIKAWQLVVAFLIASFVPSFVLASTPTVGLSGWLFALMGLMTFAVGRRLFFFSWVMGFIAVTWALSLLPFFGGIGGGLHLYCYLAGMAVGFFNSPVDLWKRR
jgi:membrane associated rhomboid family serine protease